MAISRLTYILRAFPFRRFVLIMHILIKDHILIFSPETAEPN